MLWIKILAQCLESAWWVTAWRLGKLEVTTDVILSSVARLEILGWGWRIPFPRRASKERGSVPVFRGLESQIYLQSISVYGSKHKVALITEGNGVGKLKLMNAGMLTPIIRKRKKKKSTFARIIVEPHGSATAHRVLNQICCWETLLKAIPSN